MNTGEKIKAMRIKRGYTQEELANKAGVSRITIIKLETGSQRVTTNKTLSLLGQALECEPAYFLEWKLSILN